MVEKRKLKIEVVFECSVDIKDKEGNPIAYEIKWDTNDDLETLAFESIDESTGGGPFHSGVYTASEKLREYVRAAIENGDITLNPQYEEAID
jgi:hypothetical protein